MDTKDKFQGRLRLGEIFVKKHIDEDFIFNNDVQESIAEVLTKTCYYIHEVFQHMDEENEENHVSIISRKRYILDLLTLLLPTLASDKLTNKDLVKVLKIFEKLLRKKCYKFLDYITE